MTRAEGAHPGSEADGTSAGDGPPFACDPLLGPATVADAIVACIERIVARPEPVARCIEEVVAAIGPDPVDPRLVAVRAIAGDIDLGIGAGVSMGHHNARHFIEVVLCALYLARLECVAAGRALRIASAALIHDFHHDGSRSADAPFRLERLAADAAEPYFARAGVDREERSRLRALVLATEPRAGVPFAAACHAHHRDGAPRPSLGELPAPLARLLDEPELALEAVILAEADVLPSIGLTVAHAWRVQRCLSAEWGVDLDACDKLAFVDRVEGAIRVARFFLPNVDAVRRACRRCAEEGGPPGAHTP